MHIKLTTDYALRILTYLVVTNDIANSKSISEALHIPQKNVLSIGRELKKAGLVEIISGPYGGYNLAKNPEDIAINKVINAFEDINISGHLYNTGNQGMVDTVLSQFCVELQGVIENKLKSETLASLISKVEKRNRENRKENGFLYKTSS